MRTLIPVLASLLPLLVLLMIGPSAGQIAAGSTPATNQPRTEPSPVDFPADSAIRCPLLPNDEPGEIGKVAYSPDGRTLLAGGGGFFRLYDPTTGHPVAAYKPGGGSGSLSFAPDGRSLAAPVATGRLALLDPATGRAIRALEPPPEVGRRAITAVAFASDGRTVAGAFDDGRVMLWDAATGQLARVLPPHIVPRHATGPRKQYSAAPAPARIQSLAFSPDGAALYGVSYSILHAWDVSSGRKRPMELPADFTFDLIDLAVSPDGASLAAGIIHVPGGDAPVTYSVALWDAATGRRRTELSTDKRVLAVAFLPGGRSLVALEDERVLRLWDLASGRSTAAVRFDEHFRFLPGNGAISVAVSPDGRQVAIGGFESDPMFGVIGLVDVDGDKLGPWKPKP